MIRIEEQGVEFSKVLGIVEGLPNAGDVIEVNRIPAQRLRKNREILVRIMMLGFVSEKKHAYRFCRSVPEKECQEKQRKW